jgi:hypothetical protein
MFDALGLAVTFGNELTAIVVVAVLVQPATLVPITVYVVVVVGIILTPFVTPPLHVYVFAPPPVKVSVFPAQTVVALAFAVTVGSGFDEIINVVVEVQPVTLEVPVIVYVVPAHKPVITLPTIGGITDGLIE